MADYSTTNYLIPAIKRRLMVPTTQATYQTADFLAVLNAELQAQVVPLLMSVREEYFVTSTDLAVTVGTAAYDIPSAAIGGDLRDVLMVATDGITRNLVRVEPEAVVGQPVQTGTTVGFLLQDEQVVLWPAPASTVEKLRLSYHRRPNTLVDVAAAATVVGVSGGNITVLSTPSSMQAATKLDLIKGKPQFRALAEGLQSTGGTGTTIAIAGTMPSSLAAGDYCCLTGEAPVAQIPLELQPILVLRACVAVAQSMGDGEMFGALERELAEKQSAALVLIANRVKGEQRKVPNGMNRWRGTWGVRGY